MSEVIMTLWLIAAIFFGGELLIRGWLAKDRIVRWVQRGYAAKRAQRLYTQHHPRVSAYRDLLAPRRRV